MLLLKGNRDKQLTYLRGLHVIDRIDVNYLLLEIYPLSKRLLNPLVINNANCCPETTYLLIKVSSHIILEVLQGYV